MSSASVVLPFLHSSLIPFQHLSQGRRTREIMFTDIFKYAYTPPPHATISVTIIAQHIQGNQSFKETMKGFDLRLEHC